MRYSIFAVVTSVFLGLIVIIAPQTGAFYTAAEAFGNGCGESDSQNNSGVDEVFNSATVAVTGVCDNGQVASASAATIADVAQASISLAAQGDGAHELNGAFGNVVLIESVGVRA